jgi:heat-inducible transcriptional repressor
MLTERKNRILNLIVDEYVSTAAPVASSTVADKSGLNVSPATVRNEIAKLEEGGFIHRPHVSSGAVPSDFGYRHYVMAIKSQAAPTVDDARRVDEELGPAVEDIDRWADAASSALSILLNSLAFTTPPRDTAASVKSVELVRLQELVVMLVLILQEASVYRQLITLTEPVTASHLDSTRQRLNESIAGKSATDIEAVELEGAGALTCQVRDTALGLLRRHDDLALRERRIQGLSRLLDQPEVTGNPGQQRLVLEAIEDSGTIVHLAESAPHDGSAKAIIGSENSYEALQSFSVVVCRYGSPGHAGGLVGLIAPTRMQYARALPLIGYTAAALGALTKRIGSS